MYGGYRVVAMGASPGQFFSFLTAFLLAYEPAKRLARLNIELNSNLIGARKLLEIVDSPPSEPDDSDKPALKLSDARVEFRDVTFGYRQNEPVLRRMGFVAEPGKTTALVGPSGGGKSTVGAAAAALRVNDGAILIDEQAISGVSRRSLRQQTGYVGQDVYLFRDTIGANIAFGKVGASQDEIVAAAKAACAHDFIMGFPLGYDTPVGEHGTQLSGGQRQRIAVAGRWSGAPIILLDEATAALFGIGRRSDRASAPKPHHHVIAHRLHTIMHADAILVVEAGEPSSGTSATRLAPRRPLRPFFRPQQRDAGTPIKRRSVQPQSFPHFPLQPVSPFHERSPTSFPYPQASLPVVGDEILIRFALSGASAQLSQHIREMAMTSARRRSSSPSTPTCWCPTATVPYPPLTSLHHESN
jgi:ATP-binding cassette subfamily B protein